jgi:hypothetical protein
MSWQTWKRRLSESISTQAHVSQPKFMNSAYYLFGDNTPPRQPRLHVPHAYPSCLWRPRPRQRTSSSYTTEQKTQFCLRWGRLGPQGWRNGLQLLGWLHGHGYLTPQPSPRQGLPPLVWLLLRLRAAG